MKIQFPNIAIVGTGAMGRGIAQIAAQAGSQVLLLDAHPGAADAAVGALQEQWSKLAGKGRITAQQAAEYAQRLKPVQVLSDLAGCDLVVEAIVERLDVKQKLFAELEAVVRSDAVLSSGTAVRLRSRCCQIFNSINSPTRARCRAASTRTSTRCGGCPGSACTRV